MQRSGNPQLENGFSKLANELLEGFLLSDLTKEELKITLAIVRQTYGWNKKMASISISTFEKLTGINRRNVGRSINSLLDKGMIGRSTGAKLKFGQPVYNYWLIKKGYCQYDDSTIVNATTEAIVNATTIKERNKYLKKGRKAIVDKMTMPK